MHRFDTHPLAISASFWTHRKLITSLMRRDISARYRGSMLGIAWLIIQPLCSLLVYTFVFSVVFKARWPGGSDSKTEFALILFAGLMVFNFFSETIARAPALIINNPSYVKKVVFPLEVLAFVNIGTSLFYALINLMIWLFFFAILFGLPHITALALPLLFFPLVMLVLGASWILSSLGVYIRDISHIVGLGITLLLFLSPIFYPVSALPAFFQQLMHLNPLTFVIEETRNILLWGKLPKLSGICIYWLMSAIVMWLGFAWFQRIRKGFGDVL